MDEAVKPRRIIDVSSPGKTAPHTASRPVIVSHVPTVQDPMVSVSLAANADEPSVSGAPVQTETPQSPHFVQPATQPPPQPEQDTQKQPDVKQLVHDKTYFVPVSSPPRRHGISWLFVGAILLVIAAASYVALSSR